MNIFPGMCIYSPSPFDLTVVAFDVEDVIKHHLFLGSNLSACAAQFSAQMHLAMVLIGAGKLKALAVVVVVVTMMTAGTHLGPCGRECGGISSPARP